MTPEAVEDSVGMTGRDAMFVVAKAVANRNYDELFSQIDEVVRSSKDIAVFWQDLISLYRDMLVVKTTKQAASYLDLTDHESEQLSALSACFSKETLVYHCKLLEDAFFAMQKANAVKRIVAEMTLVRMCDEALDTSTEALLSRIAKLEEQVQLGVVTPKIAPAESHLKTVETVQNVAPVPQKATPVVSAVAPTAAIAPSDKRVLRPIRSWMEVVERMGRSDPMNAGFIKDVRAYTTDDGAVVLRFENEFTLRMMERDAVRDRLRMAISAVLRREVGDRMLIMEAVASESERSLIDEIIAED